MKIHYYYHIYPNHLRQEDNDTHADLAETKNYDEDDDDDVDWEDGDDDNIDIDNDSFGGDNDNVTVDHSGEHSRSSTNQLQSATNEIYHIDDNQDHLVSKSLSSESQSAASGQLQFSSDTSDALIRAQETASKLGGWAGGALRRAIQEANGGTATAASKVMIDETLEIESDDESDNDYEDDHAAFVLQPNHFDYLAKQLSDPIDETTQKTKSPERSLSIPKQTNKGKTGERNVTWNDVSVDFDFLEQNDAQWTAERNRRERDAEAISDEMLMEVKQLLQLFGIPYMVAPAEAESQCVALERLGMVSGIVTDDSDAFVFGGKVIYKNIFEEQKYTEVYNTADAEREMRLDQNSMVALAMLLGSDYTGGVKGVGIVNAMEILNTFDVSRDLKSGLTAFRSWLDGFDPPALVDNEAEIDPEKVKISKFHLKHRTARTRWIVPTNFPADNVIKSYVDPVVDKSTDRFSWGGKYKYAQTFIIRIHVVTHDLSLSSHTLFLTLQPLT